MCVCVSGHAYVFRMNPSYIRVYQTLIGGCFCENISCIYTYKHWQKGSIIYVVSDCFNTGKKTKLSSQSPKSAVLKQHYEPTKTTKSAKYQLAVLNAVTFLFLYVCALQLLAIVLR